MSSWWKHRGDFLMLSEKEKEWQIVKPYIDRLFKEGIISFDEWYFMILSLRKKLSLLTV